MFSFLFTKNPNKIWFRNLFIITIILLCIFIYKRFFTTLGQEGFEQNEKFVLKRDSEIYDDFYVEIYDKLHKPDNKVDYYIDFINKNTQTSNESIILDVGSGTGHLVDKLNKSGIQTYGIDKSNSMIKKTEEKYPNIQCKCENVIDPLAFEKSTFSHILCMNKTIYEIEDKHRFFNNCYFWIKPGGYLIVHLVEPSKFDTIVDAGKTSIFISPQKYSKTRITDTYIDFIDFKYRANYDFKNNNEVIFKETFVDTATSHIRQNEQSLYMNDINSILKIAKSNGFIVHGKADLKLCNGDEYQYLYIFERTL